MQVGRNEGQTNKWMNSPINCGPPPGNNFYLLHVVGQGHSMVPIKMACHKNHACQVQMSQV